MDHFPNDFYFDANLRSNMKIRNKIHEHVTYSMFCYERLVYNWCLTRDAAAVYIPSSPNGFGIFELFNIPDRCPNAKYIFTLGSEI